LLVVVVEFWNVSLKPEVPFIRLSSAKIWPKYIAIKTENIKALNDNSIFIDQENTDKDYV
jgi:hypothetical protein